MGGGRHLVRSLCSEMKTSLTNAILAVWLGCAILVAGCSYFVSWDDTMEPWIGKPISRFIELNGAPDEIVVIDGLRSEYKYRFVGIDKSCVHYWLVDDAKLIIGFRSVGRCRPIG